MKTSHLICAALVLFGSTGVARAQLVNPFTSLRQRLTSKDLAMVQTRSNDLNHAAKKDAHAAWINPASGNGGTIAFVCHLTKQTKPCNVLRYTFTKTTPRPGRAYNLTRY